MKLFAHIPTIMRFGPGWTQFITTLLEVEAVRLHRTSCDSTRPRYTYSMDVLRPRETHPLYVDWAIPNGLTVRVDLNRVTANPRWRPPQFPAGCDSVDLPPSNTQTPTF